MGVVAVATLATGGLVGLVGPQAKADTLPGCAEGAAGGEWREYSHDLANSRHQPAETVIGPEQAASLEPLWVFDATDHDAGGDFNHDPIVADGCVYLGSSGGSVFALNADDGAVVWGRDLPGTVNSSPTVKHGRVYVHLSIKNAPELVVLDQSSGTVITRVVLDDEMQGTELISSPKVFGDQGQYVFSGISGASAEAGTTFTGNPQTRLAFRGIYTITDLSGADPIVSKHHTIPDVDFRRGYSGGGVWSSAAVDESTGYAFVGSGNPFSPREHVNTNAILKVDVDPRRSTFGEIVGVYHGTDDQYAGQGYKPTCDAYVDVFTCETSDFDFGASPQLFEVAGAPVVGAHQKSGVYHVASRDHLDGTLAPVWSQTVGGPFGWFGGEGTASFDGSQIVVAGNLPGLANGLDADTGAHNWITPIGDGLHFQSITTANGVAYVVDTRGVLDIFDTSTGVLLAAKQMGLETSSPTTSGFSTGFSPSVARNTVFVPFGSSVVAYR